MNKLLDTAVAVDLFNRFKYSLESNNLELSKSLLAKLKIELTKFNFLLPEAVDEAHFLLARETLELAVELYVKAKESEAFERHVAQLKTYYNDKRPSNIESQRKFSILGLHLLMLLAQNRIDEFHTELELIPLKDHDNLYIRYSIQLEQFLMEGSYNKVFDATLPPAETYQYFMDMLMGTVRSEIASCLEKAYNSLTLSEGSKLLRLDGKQIIEFAEHRKWVIKDGVLQFKSQEKPKQAIPSLDLIHQTLHYAKELERIV